MPQEQGESAERLFSSGENRTVFGYGNLAKNYIESQIQIQGSALNTDGYRISMANRETGSRGGGLALKYKNTLDCKLCK